MEPTPSGDVTWSRPLPAEVLRAADLYLGLAYDRSPPRSVAERLSGLRAAPEASFFECEAFERLGEGFALRLGNRHYPHMKLVVEPSPSRVAQFRVDTHDRHFLDLVGSADRAFAELLERNQAIAREIEDAWAAHGLRTVADHWRELRARWHSLHP